MPDNPLLKLPKIGSDSSNPLLGLPPLGTSSVDDSPLGVRSGDQQSIRDYIARLQSITPRDETQRAHIAQLIQQAQGELDTAFTRGMTDPNRSSFENIIRGASAGAIKGFTTQPAEVALGLASHLPIVGDIAKAGVKKMQQADEVVNQEFDPQGRSGALSEFGGSVLGAGPAYGSAAKMIAGRIVAGGGKGLLARAIIKASSPGATIAQRIGGGVAAGLPIQVAQGASIISPDIPTDATPEQRAEIQSATMAARLKQIAIGIAADAVFGVLPRARPEAKQEVIDAAVDPSKASQLSPERKAQLEEVQKKAAARNAVQEAIRKARKLSQADWITKNPDLEWKNLTKEEKKGVLENWLAANRTPSDTKTDTSMPTPVVDNKTPPVADIQVQPSAEVQQAALQIPAVGGLKDTMLLSDLQLLGMSQQEAQTYVSKELASGKTEADIRADIDADMKHNANPEVAFQPTGGSVGQVPSEIPPAGSPVVSGGESGAESRDLSVVDRVAANARARALAGRTDEPLSTEPLTPEEQARARIGQPPSDNRRLTDITGRPINLANPENRPSLADEVALAQQRIDTFGQLDLEHLGEEGYIDLMSRRRGKMTDAEWKKAQQLWKEHDRLYKLAKDAGEDVSMEDGFMPLTTEGMVNYREESRPEVSPADQAVIDSKRRAAEPSGFRPEPPDLSPEVQMLMQHVEAKGGLKTPEEIDSFITEIHNLDNLGLKPEEYQAHIKSIVEDFTPFEEESAQPPSVVGAVLRTKTGREFVAPSHWQALEEAQKAGFKPEDMESNDLFKTSDGRTVGRDEAGQIQGVDGPLHTDVRPPSSLSPKGAVGAPLETQPEVLKSQSSTPEGRTQNNTPELGREAPTATSVPERSTFLETIRHEDPIEQWTDGKLNKAEEKLLEKLGNLRPESPRRAGLESDLTLIMDEQKARETPSAPLTPQPLPEGLQTRQAVPESVTGAELVIDKTPQRQGIERLSGDDARRLMKSPLAKMDDGKLNAHIDDLDSRMSGNENNPDYLPIKDRLNKALEERASRSLDKGFKAQMPASVTGAVGGFVAGYFAPADSDGERTNRAWEWAAIGGAVGYLGPKFLQRGTAVADGMKPRSVSELPGGAWQNEVQKNIVTGYVEEGRQVPWLEKARRMYWGLVHRSGASEQFTSALGGTKLSTQRNPAKLFSLFGRWMGQAENAKQFGPSIVDEYGNPQHKGAPGIAQILDMVEGDQETLGALAVARTVVEQGTATKVPIDQVAALRLIHSLPEKWHQAADGLRAYSLGLADVLVDSGNLSKVARDIFSTETYYATLNRIFKFDAGSLVSAEKGLRNIVGASNPLKMRKGGSMDLIKNPVESIAESTGPIYRAAELNKIKYSFVDLWEAAGKPSEWMQLVSKKDAPTTTEHENYVASLQAEIRGLSKMDAEALATGLDPKAVDPIAGTMRVFRDGIVQTYKMPTELAKAMITLQPEEFNQLTKILGAPTRLTAKAVVYSPYFQAKMAFFDAWQATLNSQYGFRFGLDNIRGWYNVVSRSKEYQDLLAAGYQHQSRGIATSLQGNIEDIKLASGSPLEAAVKQIREMKPIEAYKTLVAPLGDAARVGEALRALDHGASVLDAVYAGRQVTANYSEIGAFSQMRALNHIIMFLNPAMQVMDQALYRGGLHPFRAPEEGRTARIAAYAAKAFMTITLPSYYFWLANQGDEEIKQLRETQTGRRYWFTRIGGSIVKIPKPILDGQVWGTSMESALDQKAGDVNNTYGDVTQSALRDAAFNILPSVGVVPFSITSNQDLQWGGPIVPDAQVGLTSSERGVDNASWLARTISKKVDVGPDASETLKNALSPAGLDYLFRSVGGSLGMDAVRAISASMDYKEKGWIPVKEEMPLTRQIFAMYPSSNVQPLQTFYDRLQHVDEVARTINDLVTKDPKRTLAYMDSNIAAYSVVGTFDQTRGVISSLRRAIVDIRNLPVGTLSSEEKHKQIAHLTQLMINQAQMANQLAESFEKHHSQ